MTVDPLILMYYWLKPRGNTTAPGENCDETAGTAVFSLTWSEQIMTDFCIFDMLTVPVSALMQMLLTNL